ncbi:copper amine oxidase [Paenibacillus sp. H1-7]|uniref:stalk domain-containing protein n=1 Tax=Paenibacillus sp. H1-7 TaxID=2282849 RepID=UPI001EF926AC|nr:stalk domain-containing protein [Paenibacillus sp. H1-7]ULL14667.1 copper amine oxidase [Paenibacillus sp. H1-7]
MKTSVKLFAASIMAASLLGGATSSWAASALSQDSLKADNGQIMTDISTFAGIGDNGSLNEEKLKATFRSPYGLLLLQDGTLLVSDSRNHLLRSVSGNKVTKAAGLVIGKDEKGFPMGGLLDGTPDRSVFDAPAGLAADAKGNVYVADSANHAIRKLDSAGNVTTLAGSGLIGSKDAAGSEASFYSPQDVAVAPNGTVYVADTLNHTIRSISPEGKVTTLTAPSKRAVEVTPGQVVWGGDYLDGTIAESKFNEPSGLVIDAKGNLYISDSGNQRIRYMDFGTGKVTTVAGGGSSESGTPYGKTDLYVPGDFSDGAALTARFDYPMGIALTDEGGLLIADSMNHSIRYLYNDNVVTLAGDANQRPGELDGIERSAQFQKPRDVAVSPDGTIYIADAYNNKIRQMKLFRLPESLPKDDQVKVVIGSNVVEFDAQPEIANGRTMVPVRIIAEALGYKVGFEEANRSVQLSKGDVTIELYLDKTGIKTMENQKQAVTKETDAAPYLKQERTYVPVRFFAEEIGLDVQWDQDSRTAILREKAIVR